jgi:hypothetical protein
MRPFSLLTSLIIISITLPLWASLSTFWLPSLNNPVKLVESGTVNQDVFISYRCSLFTFVCKGGFPVSPWFPHVKLSTEVINPFIPKYQYVEGVEENITERGIMVLIDPLWGVAWIRTKTSLTEDAVYYGPYRAWFR